MQKIIEAYKKAGYNVLPVTEHKQPAVPRWGVGIDIPIESFKDAWGFGLVMQDGLELVDFDLKYYKGDAEEFYKDICETVGSTTLKKFLIQQTKSGGYHWIYKTDESRPNQVLAQRPTNSLEKHRSYISAWEEHKDFKKAMRIAKNNKVKVLIETRGGDKGYGVIYPSPGYKRISGKIGYISTYERSRMFDILRSYNLYHPPYKKVYKNSGDKSSLIDKFCQEGDVVKLLKEYGWTVTKVQGKDVRFLRPGKTYSKDSAILDTETNIFYCYSTSTSFEPDKGYNAFQVLLELEDHNWSEALSYISENVK